MRVAPHQRMHRSEVRTAEEMGVVSVSRLVGQASRTVA